MDNQFFFAVVCLQEKPSRILVGFSLSSWIAWTGSNLVAFSLINAKALRKAYVMSLEIPRTVTVHGTSSTHKLASQFGGLENKETLSTKVKAVVYQSLTT